MENINTKNIVQSMGELDLMVMIEIDSNKKINQRSLAKTLNISLGKINYCIKALSAIGFVKLVNFSNSQNKSQYVYLLTPEGISAKILLTKKFLRIKQEEYVKLKNLIK